MQVKIYDNNRIAKTTLFAIDFEGLEYTKYMDKIGSCIFDVRTDNPKITSDVLNNFNRLEIIEGSGLAAKVVFTGYIIQKVVTLDTIEVRCDGLIGLLRKRNSTDGFVLNGTINDSVQSVIDEANSISDTFIVSGTLAGVGTTNRTLEGDNLYNALKDMVEETGNQLYFNHETSEINVLPQVGNNLTSTVSFRYDIRFTANANLASFEVEDSGADIVTQAIGHVGATRSEFTDAALVTKFGLVQRNDVYRTMNVSELATATENKIQDTEFSPKLDLGEGVEDNFDVADLVSVLLYNVFIDIDESYQILEKNVSYTGSGEKQISVKVNKIPKDDADLFAEQQRDIELLKNHV